MDEILDKCLDRLRDGESVEQILLSYPDRHADLEPLLQISAATIRVVNKVTMEPVVKQRRLHTFMSAVTDREERQDKFHWTRVWRNNLGRSVVVALGLGVLATGTAFGASIASDGSVPGDPLYPVKSLREDISLRIPKSNLERAKQHAHLANVRNQEIGQLVDRGRYEDARELVVRITYHLGESAEILGVTITANANPFELPPRKVPQTRSGDAAKLAAYMESDVGQYERSINRRMQRMAEFQRQQMRLLQWKWELRYRAYVQALAYDGPPLWPVWIDSQVPAP